MRGRLAEKQAVSFFIMCGGDGKRKREGKGEERIRKGFKAAALSSASASWEVGSGAEVCVYASL